MKKTFKFLLLLNLVLILSTLSFAQIPFSKIDSLVIDAMSKFKVAGVSMAIVKDGNLIFTGGFGYADINTKQLVNENTNFQIASNT